MIPCKRVHLVIPCKRGTLGTRFRSRHIRGGCYALLTTQSSAAPSSAQASAQVSSTAHKRGLGQGGAKTNPIVVQAQWYRLKTETPHLRHPDTTILLQLGGAPHRTPTNAIEKGCSGWRNTQTKLLLRKHEYNEVTYSSCGLAASAAAA